jgi:hypothetical protein
MYDVHFPGDRSGGRGQFGNWLLNTYETSKTFRSKVEAIIILSDNDVDPDAAFKAVQHELTKASGFPVPATERTVAKARDYPAVAVFMVPGRSAGNLETLCLQAAYDKWSLNGAVDSFIASTPAAEWELPSQSKARMHAILATTCASKPETTFAYHFQEDEKYHVPVLHSAFDDLAEFLSNFDKLLAG